MTDTTPEPDPPQMDTQDGGSLSSIGHRIARGAIVILVMWLFWKFGGFLMRQVINYFFTDDPAVLSVYTAVYGKLVYLIFYASVLKVVKPAFMPLFAERMHREGERAAWDLASTILNLMLLFAVAAGAVAFWLTPEIVGALLPEFSGESKEMAVILLRWMAPGLAALAFAIAALALLTSYKIFSYPSAADAVQKILWAGAMFAGLVILGEGRSTANAPHVIGISFLIGCVAQVIVLVVGMRKQLRLYRFGFPSIPWQRAVTELAYAGGAAVVFLGVLWASRAAVALPEGHALHLNADDQWFVTLTAMMVLGSAYAGLIWIRLRRSTSIIDRFAVLASPLLVGVLFARYANIAEMRFQSGLESELEGAFGVVELARGVALMPTVVFGHALAIVMIPFLADLAARNRRDDLGELVGRTVRFMLLYFLPLAILTIVLGESVMRFLWDHKGAWSPKTVQWAGLALGTFAIIIPILAIENVLSQAFFSIQQTVLPAAMGILFAIVHTALVFTATKVPAIRDNGTLVLLVVCGAEPARRLLKNLALFLFLRRQLKLGQAPETISFLLRLAVICVATGAAAWLVTLPMDSVLPLARYAPKDGGGKLMFLVVRGVRLTVPALAGLTAFLSLCVVLRMQEFHMVTGWIRARLPGRWRSAS